VVTGFAARARGAGTRVGARSLDLSGDLTLRVDGD
jgi:hypothetical protein